MSESALPALTVTGPIDRESFFDAQRRHRRSARAYLLLCGLLVTLLCAVMSVLLAPLVVAIAGLVIDLLNLAVPLPDLLGAVWKHVAIAIDSLDTPAAATTLPALIAWPAAIGVLLFGGLWIALRRLFSRAGIDGLLAPMGLRDPRASDPEERQLVNLVEEMAIAAGVPPPTLRLSDAAGVNAAAIGTSTHDTVLFVSRALLERLDRDATQGVIAHLIAAIGHGDMAIGHRMVTTMAMLSVLSQVVQSPMSPDARHTLRRLARFALGHPTPDEADALLALLANPFDERLSRPEPEKANRVLALMGMPALMVDLLISRSLNLFVLSPVLAMAWRHRKYLADAAAVQLTRMPDGLALALSQTADADRHLPGAAWGAHLCALDPAALVTAPGAGGLAGSGMPFLPSANRRMKRLAGMGSTIRPVDGIGRMTAQMLLILVPVGVLLAGLIGTLVVLGTWLIAMLSMLFIALPVGIVHTLLRWLAT